MPETAPPTVDTVAAEIIRGLGEQLPQQQVTPQTELFNGLGLDSLTMTALLVSLEDRFRIRMREEDAGELRTVRDLAALVVQRIGERS